MTTNILLAFVVLLSLAIFLQGVLLSRKIDTLIKLVDTLGDMNGDLLNAILAEVRNGKK